MNYFAKHAYLEHKRSSSAILSYMPLRHSVYAVQYNVVRKCYTASESGYMACLRRQK